jgi:hypothetical protein
MYVFLKYIVKNENLDIFNSENGVIADSTHDGFRTIVKLLEK